MMLFLRMAKW